MCVFVADVGMIHWEHLMAKDVGRKAKGEYL
jgi:hypothetical protein